MERQVRECRSLIEQSDGVALEALDRVEASPLWNGLRDFGWSDRGRPSLLLRAMTTPTEGATALEALAKCGEDGQPALVGHPAHGTVSAALVRRS